MKSPLCQKCRGGVKSSVAWGYLAATPVAASVTVVHGLQFGLDGAVAI